MNTNLYDPQKQAMNESRLEIVEFIADAITINEWTVDKASFWLGVTKETIEHLLDLRCDKLEDSTLINMLVSLEDF